MRHKQATDCCGYDGQESQTEACCRERYSCHTILQQQGCGCLIWLVALVAMAFGVCGVASGADHIADANKMVERGLASWYGADYHGFPVACQPGPDGKEARYDMNAMTAAHLTRPCGQRVRVCLVGEPRCVVVRINDRGPFVEGRVVDLSMAAARRLGIVERGVAAVTIQEQEEKP